MGALRDVTRTGLDQLCSADDRIERRSQLVAHVGQEPGLCQRCGLRLVTRTLECQHGLLLGGDIGAQADRHPAVRAAVVDAIPAPVKLHFAHLRSLVQCAKPGLPVLFPGLPIGCVDRVQACGGIHGAQYLEVRRTRLQCIGAARVPVAELAVADDQPVLVVEHQHTDVQGLDSVKQLLARGVQFPAHHLGFGTVEQNAVQVEQVAIGVVNALAALVGPALRSVPVPKTVVDVEAGACRNCGVDGLHQTLAILWMYLSGQRPIAGHEIRRRPADGVDDRIGHEEHRRSGIVQSAVDAAWNIGHQAAHLAFTVCQPVFGLQALLQRLVQVHGQRTQV
jgi:hypothetical protein